MSNPNRPEPTAAPADAPHDAAYYERLVIGKSARPRRRWGLMALAAVLLAGGSHAAVRLAHRNDDLRLAVIHCDLPQINRLLAWGADANLRGTSKIRDNSDESSARNTGKTMLMMGVSTGKPAIVDAFLAHGADPNLQLSNGQTALLLACSMRDPAIVRSLLAHGADARRRDAKGRTPLLCAARGGRTENVQALLDHGANIEETDGAQQSALCLASALRHEDTVRLLLARGANIDSLTQGRLTQDEWQTQSRGLNYQMQIPGGHWTPLAWAASVGSPSLVAAIWDTRLTPQEREQKGPSALDMAISSGNPDTVATLLDRHLPVEVAAPTDPRRPGVYSYMPLYWAAQAHNLPLCQMLIARGAHVNGALQSNLGTPLMAAASDSTPFIVRLLLEHGADVNATDADGKTALMECVSSTDIPELLLAHGADVNARDHKGRSALQYITFDPVMRVLLLHGADARGSGLDDKPLLSYAGSPEVIELLIAHGADANARDPQGKTPLMTAYNHMLVPALIAHGADVNARDNQGTTPLHAALQHNMDEVLKLLLEYGANPDAPDASGVTPRMLAQQRRVKAEVDAFAQVPAH